MGEIPIPPSKAFFFSIFFCGSSIQSLQISFERLPSKAWPDTQSQLSLHSPRVGCLLTGKSTAEPPQAWFFLSHKIFFASSPRGPQNSPKTFLAQEGSRSANNGGLRPPPQGSGGPSGRPHVHVPEVQSGRRGRGKKGQNTKTSRFLF